MTDAAPRDTAASHAAGMGRRIAEPVMPDDLRDADPTSEPVHIKPAQDAGGKTEVISVRFLPDEVALLPECGAGSAYKTISAFIRAAALDAAAGRETSSHDLRRCIGTLGRIGARIDALAQQASDEGLASIATDLQSVIREMRALMLTMTKGLT